jgi:hypothetical protein
MTGRLSLPRYVSNWLRLWRKDTSKVWLIPRTDSIFDPFFSRGMGAGSFIRKLRLYCGPKACWKPAPMKTLKSNLIR